MLNDVTKYTVFLFLCSSNKHHPLSAIEKGGIYLTMLMMQLATHQRGTAPTPAHFFFYQQL